MVPMPNEKSDPDTYPYVGSGHVVAVNGRFLTMPISGVQRYGREVLSRLVKRLPAEVIVVVPPLSRMKSDDLQMERLKHTRRWTGARGHVWEQVVLPRLYRRSEAGTLLSLCNWGPLGIREQVLVIFDLAPLKLKSHFSTRYRLLVRNLQQPLARRVLQVVTLSESVRAELIEIFGLDPSRVSVAPPGVGPPFTSYGEFPSEPGNYCLFVGGHDSRKNLEFLLRFWPELHSRTGLELKVVGHRASSPHGFRRSVQRIQHIPGVSVYREIDDAELASLYRSALCVLHPSLYEGFGLPLLEGIASGTPFVSTDVGAAAELAVDTTCRILPLNPRLWEEHILELRKGSWVENRQALAESAGRYTWDKTAKLIADAIHKVGVEVP
jgi:glycosyltransferase involved in cell wall biosynthesis